MPKPGDYAKPESMLAKERKIEGELMAGLVKWAKKDPASRGPVLKRMGKKRGDAWLERMRELWRDG